MAKTVSVIIPTFNMAKYLPGLWDSIVSSNLIDQVAEVIFVNDASTDETAEILLKLEEKSKKIRRLTFTSNQGRFKARFKGAEIAQGSHLLFIDSRVLLAPEFGQALNTHLAGNEALMAVIDIDVKKSVYNLYWQRTHELIFHRNFHDAKTGFFIRDNNYESYAKGTGTVLLPRGLFLEVCCKYSDRDLLSDDTLLLKEIVKKSPIWVHHSLATTWEPRQSYWPFMMRLWERGPQFVEYHVLARRGVYFYLFVAWCAAVSGTILLTVVSPLLGLTILAAGLAALALSTAVFSKSPAEFLRMLFVHVSTILFYGFGAIYGLWYNLSRTRHSAH